MSKVVIITGPPGAGKSTLVVRLAEKASKGVAIQADRIRKMVRGGYVLPWMKNEERKNQRKLTTKNICDITKNSLKAGFDVYIDDVLPNAKLVKDYRKVFGKKIKIFLLLPSEKILIKRLKERKEDQVMFDRTKELRKRFSDVKDKIDWIIIDNSSLTIEETSKLILK